MQGPILVSLASLATFTLLGHTLTAAVAFPALALFDLLSMPVNHIPMMISELAVARASLGRISTFLAAPELTGRPSTSPADTPDRASVKIVNGTFSWEAGELMQNRISGVLARCWGKEEFRNRSAFAHQKMLLCKVLHCLHGTWEALLRDKHGGTRKWLPV